MGRSRRTRLLMSESRMLVVPAEAAGQRLDQFLTSQLDGVSRSRVQLLLEQGDVVVDGGRLKASSKLRGGESIVITGEPRPAPLRAVAEDIPLQVVFEDADLAVIDKPAGMMVHAGSGQTEDARNRGTLVNALLHRFRALSATSGELRPGIVHRLDKDTSGLIIVAKNDRTHAALAEMFSTRKVKKTYIALVHGSVERPKGTITAAISRDPVRRTRMTTRVQEDGRSAVSHYEVTAGSRPDSANSRWCGCASKPAAPTRYASTWLPSGILWWAIPSTGPRVSLPTRPRCRQLPPKPPGAKLRPRNCGWVATSFMRRNWSSPTRRLASLCRSHLLFRKPSMRFWNGWKASPADAIRRLETSKGEAVISRSQNTRAAFTAL